MVRRYDVLHAVILILILAIANIIGNSIVKGILLLLFSAVLIFNSLLILMQKKEDILRNKIFYGILLFLNILLAIGAIIVIIAAI